MAGAGQRRLVLRSLESDDGGRCVDLFRRNDGSFGFEEYRRDPEDASGWGPAGAYGHLEFDSENAALAAALDSVGWLAAGGRVTQN